MRTLGLIRRATPAPDHDLWTRLQTRLRERDEVVRVSFPRVGWGEVAALAAVIAIIAVVPDPLGFLVASGML